MRSCLFSTGTATSPLLLLPPQAWRGKLSQSFYKSLNTLVVKFHPHTTKKDYLKESYFLVKFEVVCLKVSHLAREDTQLQKHHSLAEHS